MSTAGRNVVGVTAAIGPAAHAAPVPLAASARAGLARLTTAPALVGLALLAAGFIALTWRWFRVQGQLSWWQKEDWGHAYIIPLITAWLIWQKRDLLASLPARVYWPGLLAVITGIASYVFLIVGFNNHMGQGFSLVIVIWGLVLLLAGPGIARALFLPIAYLGFGVTLSDRIMIDLTFKLQQLAAQGSEIALAVLGAIVGFSITRDGNTLTVSYNGEVHPLNVAEACSGMRMVVAFYALSGAAALLACRHWWQRIAVVLLAGPVALLMNVMRVTVLGLLTLVNPELAAGNAHMVIGTILLVPSLGLFLLIVWALNRMIEEPTAPAAAAASKAKPARPAASAAARVAAQRAARAAAGQRAANAAPPDTNDARSGGSGGASA